MFNPKYTITDSILNNLSKISEIRSLVTQSSLLPAREAFLRRVAIVKMAHTSTSIEGNVLNEYQVEKLAEGKKVIAQQDQVLEVENYLSALGQIDGLSDNKRQMDVSDILAIHKTVISGLVDSEKVGVFRKGPVYIVNVLPKGEEELAYIPPVSEQVPILIDNLLNWLQENSNIHPIIRAGLFHYQFETIHPFTDGNGRTGRLTTLLHLYQSDWDLRKVLVLEDYYNRDRKKYYESLQTGSTYENRQGVDLTSWLEYYVEGFLEEAVRVKDQVQNLSIAGIGSESGNILDNDELKIVDFLVSMGKITSSDVVDILQVPKRTAQSKLKKLEEIKVVEKRGAGPKTYYVVPKIKV